MNNQFKTMTGKRDGYDVYTPEVVLKRVFKYILRSKVLILSSLLFLMLFTILELFQPQIVSTILNDHLYGVQTVWVVESDANENENEVMHQGNYYHKASETEIHDGSLQLVTIVYYENEYYIIAGIFEKTTDIDKKFFVSPLTVEELRNFYEPSVPAIYRLLIYYVIIMFLITIFRFFQSIFFQNASMRLTYEMRVEAFDKLNRLPIKYFSSEPSGKIVTKIISDSEGVRGLYNVFFQIVSAVISLVMVYSALFIAQWKLALISLAFAPVVLLWMTIYRKINNRYHHKIREMNSIINASMAQYVTGMEIIQDFNKEKMMEDEYDELLIANYNNKMRALKINAVFGAELLVLIQNILIGVIIFYFGYTVLNRGNGNLNVGLLYIYIVYVGRLIEPILTIFHNLNHFEDSFVASSRIFEFLDQTEDKYLGFSEKPTFKGAVEFKNINFSYVDNQPVLKDISFKVNAGDFIGLVGHTGSGKSTLMTLIQRFYDLQEGQILIDDEDFMNYTKQEVRSNIGYVLQDPAIFSGTIKSNINLSQNLDDQAIINVFEMIGAHKFVSSFPEGINTQLEYMGSNLSTGEKQLISFARILLKNPAILILDEATANIDTETEQLIQNALSVLAKNRTTFVVAHRLSTIKNATCIYVLDDGYIVESGTHEQLYNKENGFYRKMYDAQYHINDK